MSWSTTPRYQCPGCLDVSPHPGVMPWDKTRLCDWDGCDKPASYRTVTIGGSLRITCAEHRRCCGGAA